MAGTGTPSDVLSSTLFICGGSAGKEPACPLQAEKAVAPYSNTRLENPMDGGAWKAAVHGVAEGRTRLSDWACTNTQGAAQAQGTVLNVL